MTKTLLIAARADRVSLLKTPKAKEILEFRRHSEF